MKKGEKELQQEIFNQFRETVEKKGSIPVIIIHGKPLENGQVEFRISQNSALHEGQIPAIINLLNQWIDENKKDKGDAVDIEKTKDNFSRI